MSVHPLIQEISVLGKKLNICKLVFMTLIMAARSTKHSLLLRVSHSFLKKSSQWLKRDLIFNEKKFKCNSSSALNARGGGGGGGGGVKVINI